MKLSLHWLRQWVDLKNLPPEKIGQSLTLHTAELEEILDRKKDFAEVYAGKLLEFHPHPKADNLFVAQFDLGKTRGKKQIIFGQVHELTAGTVYPVALEGARLPSGIAIRKTTLRGEVSEGMVCDNPELGMKNEGLLSFSPVDAGKPISEILAALSDHILDIDNKSLTHRPDLLGHRGFARELGAIFDRKLLKQEPKISFPSSGKKVDVEIQTKNGRRFCAVEMSGISVGPSPLEEQMLLENLGIRAISNIVDVTNLVLLEYGQPMHAFDADKISGKIIVRQAKKGETLLALDGEEYTLCPDDIVIADEKKVLSIAGIMGGEASSVTEKTTRIIFESANFDGARVRHTSARLGLRSESSMRFEKSLDPEQCIPALQSACARVLSLCQKAQVSAPITDEYPHPFPPLTIDLDPELVRARAGISITDAQIKKHLESIGFTVSAAKKGFSVEVPSWRRTKDVEIPEDLIEEVVRLHGFENIPAQLPTLPITPPGRNKFRSMEWGIRHLLAHHGFREVYHSSFVGPQDPEWLEVSPEKYVQTINAHSEEYLFLRQRLVSNFVRSLESELRSHGKVSFFEIGKVYLPPVNEEARLCLFFAEMGSAKEFHFFWLKKQLELLFDHLSIAPDLLEFRPAEKPSSLAHPTRSADILLAGKRIGEMAQLLPPKNPVNRSVAVFAELDLVPLLSHLDSTGSQYLPPSSYPAVRRDLSLIVSERTLSGELQKAAFGAAPNLQKMELFDDFSDENKFGAGKKNVAFHLTFRSAQKTLTEAEVESQFQAIVTALGKKHDATLRLDFSRKKT
ncbi:MAG: phenylalanine--tRNA ligase subunit beta [Candidatus Gracilibacteria bacterium]|nr:phenylalanine--tRNA ligase subunit beta [Candidatus Gracilibacteria bacterium]